MAFTGWAKRDNPKGADSYEFYAKDDEVRGFVEYKAKLERNLEVWGATRIDGITETDIGRFIGRDAAKFALEYNLKGGTFVNS